MRASFQTKLISATQWRTQKVSKGGLKFRRSVTSQINIVESAVGKTIVGWSGSMLRKKFAKLHSKHAFSCIMEASFSIMLLRDLPEEWNRKMKMLQKHYGIKKLGHLWRKKTNQNKDRFIFEFTR